MTKHLIREHLFKLLFQIEFNEESDYDKLPELFFEIKKELADVDDDDADEAAKASKVKFDEKTSAEITEKFEKILAIIPELDAKLNEKMEGWDTTRVGKVELTIMRLALYEMLYDDEVPVSVAINEAVEIAKTYGPDNAGSFVNGVLAKFAGDDGK